MKNKYEIRGEVTAVFINYRGQQYETNIDTNDLQIVDSFPKTWYGYFHKDTKQLYVYGNSQYVYGKATIILMHRWLMGEPHGLVIDHINHNALDNRRSVNLRAVTNAENLQNRSGARKDNGSGIRGVGWHKQRKKWRAHVGYNGKSIHLGLFDDINAAAKAAEEARMKYLPFSK
jgi:hypothetical protein